MGRKLEAVPLGGGVELGPHITQCCPPEAYIRTKRHLDPYSLLATINMDRKVGFCLFLGGELGPHLTQCGPRPEAYLHAKCHLEPSSRLATIDMGRKFGGSVPFWGRELGSI